MGEVRRDSLTEAEWLARKSAHEQRVDTWIQPYLTRRSLGVSHPVEDFLFTYYSYRPASLRRWHPGVGVELQGEGAAAFGALRGYVVTGHGVSVDPTADPKQVERVRWIRRLLGATADRPMALSCFGLHEWAMVYRQPAREVRHATYPLRLGATGTDEVVEQHRIACTHHDAFRFFTSDARPRNALSPTRETQHEHDQPGCLHATMDCYKWAYKLTPFTSAELVADCFALAREVRFVDMRAAPYDLSALGLDPIPIETPAGKSAYVAAQREFAGRAKGLRDRLINRVRPRPSRSRGIDVCDVQRGLLLWDKVSEGRENRSVSASEQDDEVPPLRATRRLAHALTPRLPLPQRRPIHQHHTTRKAGLRV